MIEVDGSQGEGGGQILRTALALSCIAQKPVHVTNIRKGRPNPGLQAQHLEAVNAMSLLCAADVQGAKLRSQELTFTPNSITDEKIGINIPTAGSVGLVLQPVMIAAAQSGCTIDINGGATNGKWAMPANYAKHVLIPLLEKMNYSASINIDKYGYYPKGGAKIAMKIEPRELRPVDFLERGEILDVDGISHASSDLKPKLVAERQAKTADALIEKNFPLNARVKVLYNETRSTGSAIELFARTANSVLGSDGLGELRTKAEDVGREAAQRLVAALKSNACVDEYAEDQLLPYLAIAGGGSMRVPALTGHTKTNVWVIEKFLPVRFKIDEKEKLIVCKSE